MFGLTFGLLMGLLSALSASAQDGPSLYAAHCARCHDSGGFGARVPSRSTIAQLAPERIVASLETGTMRTQATTLREEERRAIAVFITGRGIGATMPPVTARGCADASGAFSLRPSQASWNGWAGGATNTRYQPAAGAGLKASQVPALRVKWAFGFPGEVLAAAQPVVAGGRVFVGSSSGRVFSLSLRSGCTYWTFDADAMVRSAITVAAAGGRALVFIADVTATVYAVDASTGALVWRRRVDDHPAARITGSPSTHGGRLYVPVSSVEEGSAGDPKYECCTFRGSVVALDAATGSIVWKSHTIPDQPAPRRLNKVGTQLHGPSGAAVWSAPTIDPKAGVLYIATGDSYSDPVAPTSDAILAMDLESGALKWSQQMTENDGFNLGCLGRDLVSCPETRGPDHDFGSPPMLIALASGRRMLVIGQKSGVVHALDPDDRGRVLWSTRVGKGGMLGGIEWGSATDGRRAYVAVSDVAFKGGRALDPSVGGGIAAVSVTDGRVVWKADPPGCGDRASCSPAQSAAITAIPGVVFSGSLDGHLRAYATETGRVVWDVDTVRDFETVNGVRARGGSIDVAGPAIVDGILLQTSGYAAWGGMAGNVLLAFSVNGK